MQDTCTGSPHRPDSSVPEKAAALLHSRARSHALVDGNKRLALAGVIAFLGVNGQRLTLTNDEAYDLIMGVAGGELDDVSTITGRSGPGARSPGSDEPSTRHRGTLGVQSLSNSSGRRRRTVRR